ncbi:MAG: xanthine dehydrogenase family protein subunit M [Deltaproteobacteria bacterium]|nr:xanthine dehydrogenase family protein subunit M [Deltaproteobacteria bacterium]
MKYFRPGSLEELLVVLGNSGESAKLLAGGTDLMLALRVGRRFGALVNITRVEQLRGIAQRAGPGRPGVRLGALVTVAELLRSPLIRSSAPLLWQAADRFASPLVRSRATVGGNLCNGSPAADLGLALLALDARVELESMKGRRTLPIEELFRGPGRTAIEPDEVLVAVDFPSQSEGMRSAFEKSGTRPALEIAVASVAASLELRAGRVTSARIAYGSVAPVPMRGAKVEELLVGRELTDGLILEAARAAAAEARPIDDVRGTQVYRRRLVGAFVRRALTAAREERVATHV